MLIIDFNVIIMLFYENITYTIVVEFQGHSLNKWVGYVSVWVRRRGGTNGGETHSSARLSLHAATGRGESILFDIFPSCAYFSNKGSIITFILASQAAKYL